jgi:hypothetical protein
MTKIFNNKNFIDLAIIGISSVGVLLIFIIFNQGISSYVYDSSNPLLLRLIIPASLQFGIAGLGIVIIKFLRKESWINYGLNKKNAIKSILFSFISFGPYIIVRQLTNPITSYRPFQMVELTRWLEGEHLITLLLGYLLIATCWGFFEGFNYVVISSKVNQWIPVKNMWLNWGAISCSMASLLIHGMFFTNVLEFVKVISVFFIIYGILVTVTQTKNAWGIIFAFLLMWNAF